jgi:TatD DNase family protein
VIDSHCHLADEVFSGDLEAVVERGRAAGVERVLAILEAGNRQEAEQAARLRAMWPETGFAIGVHPHIAHQYAENPARAREVVRGQIADTPATLAIGEIGLDYHYDYTPRDVQHEVFRNQVRLARELRLPVVIHTREADQDTLTILKEEGGGELRGVLHCFTGTAALASAALDLGFYISVAGIVTFPKAGQLRATVQSVPTDRLLTETDSPFLAPVPHRGKRNEPAFVAEVVATVAQLIGLGVEEAGRQTRANFHTLFRP